MEKAKRDTVEFTDGEGGRVELEIEDRFEYGGREYAVMSDPLRAGDDWGGLFLFRILCSGECEEFLPVGGDGLEELAAMAEKRMARRGKG